MSEPIELITLPTGVETIGGGTRSVVKLDRPWQTEMPIDPTTCPFCTKRSGEPSLLDNSGDWKVLRNDFTPYAFHRLLIPSACWPREELAILGGAKKMEEAFLIADRIIKAEKRNGMWVTANIGYLAGQNVCHVHYHIFEPNEIPQVQDLGLALKTVADNDLSVSVGQTECCSVFAGGVRAGQLLILPKMRSRSGGQPWQTAMAEVFSDIISLGEKKFRSKQGAAPHYTISMKFLHGRFNCASYIPILNHWGANEYFSLMQGTPLALAWPHHTTAEYLRG